MARMKSFRARWTAALVAVVAAGSTGLAAGPAHSDSGACPTLFVFGVQGTDQSSADASPNIDSGALAQVMKPLLTMAGSMVQRAYVPYPASFGGATESKSSKPFDQSVTEAVNRTRKMTAEVAGRCPDTSFAYTGYSQGAQALGIFLREIGAGKGPIAPEKMAGASLFGDPTRPSGSGLFPGRPEATTPEPAPQTDGEAVAKLAPRNAPVATGGGIGPVAEQTTTYGALDGRVASSCEPGDLACDAPADAPVVHIVTNLVGQSNLDMDDPVQALGSVAEALALTTAKTVVPVINEDISGETVEDLSYQPQVSISKRLAVASDPRIEMPTIDDSIRALLKVGTIGLNAVVTVAKKVLNPSTLTQLGTVGLANPPAALAVLGSKVLEATVELVPPATASRWTSEAFDAVKQNVSDNSELLDVANLVRY